MNEFIKKYKGFIPTKYISKNAIKEMYVVEKDDEIEGIDILTEVPTIYKEKDIIVIKKDVIYGIKKEQFLQYNKILGEIKNFYVFDKD